MQLIKRFTLFSLLFLVVLSTVGCKEDDPNTFMKYLDKAYKNYNAKKFEKFIKHFDPSVKGEGQDFTNYNQIINFYRKFILDGSLGGVDLEFYQAEKQGEFIVADYKEVITYYKDGKRHQVERVLRVWVKPLGKNFKVYKVKVLKIPEGAGTPLF